MNPAGAISGVLVALLLMLVWSVAAAVLRRRGRRAPRWASLVAVAFSVVAGYAVGVAYYVFYSLEWMRDHVATDAEKQRSSIDDLTDDVRRLAWALVLLVVLGSVLAYRLGRARRASSSASSPEVEAATPR